MMRWAILLSGIIELIGGVIIYLYPDYVFPDSATYLSGLYGVAAITLGVINLLVFKFYNLSISLSSAIVITMMGFHGLLSIYISKVSLDFLPLRNQASATHLVIFVVILLCYLKDKRAMMSENQ